MRISPLLVLPGKKNCRARAAESRQRLLGIHSGLLGIALCDFPAEGSALPNYPANDAVKRADYVIGVAYSRPVEIPSRLYRAEEEEKFLLGHFARVIHILPRCYDARLTFFRP
jgi:hypothetical protein